MIPQTTLARSVRLAGAGLHTGALCAVTLHPAPGEFGRRIGSPDGYPRPVTWEYWRPSRMSTSLDLGSGRAIRTIEHMMAALAAHDIDNVRIEVDGPEIPILDGSARPWCRRLIKAGVRTFDAPRRAIRVVKPVQVEKDGGFLRAEPAARFEVDVTHDVLPSLPVMRWQGAIDGAVFDEAIAGARSFGDLHRRLGLALRPITRPLCAKQVIPNAIAPSIAMSTGPWDKIAALQADTPPGAPLLRGWRPWRATLVAGARILPWPRFADEPGRHVTLDMIGDLTLAGAPLIGRVIAHNPSHEKTFALVLALMAGQDTYESVQLA